MTTESFKGTGLHPWSWDLATGRVQWSDGVAVLFGVAPQDAPANLEDFLAVVHEDDRAQMRADVHAALESGRGEFLVQHRVALQNGEVRWVEGRAEIVRDPAGRPSALRGVVWDVTARKRSELREQRSRRLFAVMAAINRESLRARDVDSLLAAACRIVVEEGGFRFAWIGLKDAEGRVVPKVRSGFEDRYLDLANIRAIGTDPREGPTMRALREREPVVCNDIAHDPAYGTWRAAALERGYRASAAFPFESAGVPVGTLNVYADQAGVFADEEVQLLSRLAADIGVALERSQSEQRRREAEAALAASEERYRALFEQAGDGIMQFSEQRIILDANSALCAMHGYSREELIGQPIGILMAEPEIIDRLKVKQVIERGEVFRVERLARRRDGSTFQIESSVARLATGERLAVVRDVSVRNRLNAEVAQNERLLALGRLARGVAHEINNPLAYVMMNLEILERAGVGKLDDRFAPALASAQEGADRVRHIVRDLSTFGRGEEEEIGPVDLDAVLGSALNLTEGLIKPVARLLKDFRAGRRARGNAYRLGQVAVNLLVNAADAMASTAPATNELRVSTFGDAESVSFTVADTGPGIDPAIAPRIFDPFFTTKPVGAGTGLGLSVAHTIVASLGGSISVQSQPGRGASFTVRLPAWADAATAPKAPAPDERSKRAKRRILVVDDEPAIRHALERGLSGDEVTLASGGFEAAALCREREFDCILCDVTMPRGDGVDLLEALKGQGRGADQRIIFMSGGAYSARTEQLLAQADHPRLDKPFTTAAASEAIDALIARCASATRQAG